MRDGRSYADAPGRRLPLVLAGVLAALVAGCSSSSGVAPGAAVAEPAYCAPAAFVSHEVAGAAGGLPGLVRLHAFRLGGAVVAGLAVGSSDTASVRALAGRYSAATAADGYCTWYVNNGSPEAARTFVFRYVPDPRVLTTKSGPPAYLEMLGGSFAEERPSFLSCVRDRGYLAVGCDGQKHRGPTVFGMLLAFSGCSPEHSLAIVDELWGLNDVKPEVRLAIIRAAYEYGRAHPEQSAALGEILSAR